VRSGHPERVDDLPRGGGPRCAGPSGRGPVLRLVRGLAGTVERCVWGVLASTFPELAHPETRGPGLRLLVSRALDGPQAALLHARGVAGRVKRGALLLLNGNGGRPAEQAAGRLRRTA
jgi:hypothetical protein